MSRIDRINQQMKREIGTILLRELSDPRVQFVSITNVSTSKDLRSAKVYFSVLGGSSKVEDAAKALDSAKGYIRKLVGDSLSLRYNPELRFHYDETIEYSSRIEGKIKELSDEGQ